MADQTVEECLRCSGGLGGFYSLQVENLLVPPKRVWLSNFRTLEAVTLADLQDVQVGDNEGSPTGFHAAGNVLIFRLGFSRA